MENQKKSHIVLQDDEPLIKYQSIDTIQGYEEKDKQFLEHIQKIIQTQKGRQGINAVELTQEQIQDIIEKATLHSLANQFNQTSKDKFENIKIEDRCLCGCRHGTGPKLSIWTDEEHLSYFGPGVILLFLFIRKLIIIFLILTSFYGIYSLVTNFRGPIRPIDCPDDLFVYLCRYKTLTSIDRKNKLGGQFMIQLWLGVIFSIFWIIGIRLLKKIGRQKNQQIDQHLQSSSDFSIKIDNLPFGKYHQQQLIEYLYKLWQAIKQKYSISQQLSIKSVQIIYNMQQIRKITSQLKEQIKKLNNYIYKGSRIKQQYINQYKIKKQNIIKIYQKLIEIRFDFLDQPLIRSKYATSSAIIQFGQNQQQILFLQEYGSYRQTLIKSLKHSIAQLCFQKQSLPSFKNKDVLIRRAPQPSDINWQNCQKKSSMIRVLIVWAITFVIILISFGVSMLIRQLIAVLPALKDFTILFSISLQFFNRLIWNTILAIIDIEQHSTKTDAIISTMNKSAFCQGVNVLVIPLINNIILKDNLSGGNGLAGLVLDYQIMVFFFMILWNLVNVPYIIRNISINIKYIRNWVIRSKVKMVGELQYSDFKQVLTYYQNPDFPIAASYVYLTTIVNHSMFYIHLQPTLFITMIFNLTLFYFIMKYLLYKRCKIPALTDLVVFETCLNLMLYAPAIYGIGSLIFISRQTQKMQSIFMYIAPSILCILLTPFVMIDPYDIFDKLTIFFLDLIPKGATITPTNNQTDQKHQTLDKREIEQILSAYVGSLDQFSTRLQSYYKECNSKNLLSFEHNLKEITQRQMHIRSKIFCQTFKSSSSESQIEDVEPNINKNNDGTTIKLFVPKFCKIRTQLAKNQQESD